MNDDPFRAAYLRNVAWTYRNYKALGERAIAQVPDEALHALIDADANSLAILVRHVAGNLRSRFTEFLTTDGEKPTRNRDAEFEPPERASRADLLADWDSGWAAVLGAVDALTPADLDRTVHIGGRACLVLEALQRSITHTAYHVAQIVFLAKHFAGPHWNFLSAPKRRPADVEPPPGPRS